MPIEDPIELNIQQQFHAEKLSRTIKECSDIETLRSIAIELLKLQTTKSAVAQWATKRALEAELRANNASKNHKQDA